IDECYKDYCFPKQSYISPFNYWKGENNKIIMINSFSKNLALTGWRLGYICAVKEIVEKVSIFQSHTSSNPSSLIQDAIRKILLTDTVNKFIDSNWIDLNEKRNYVLNSFKYLKANEKFVNQGGFFFYINVSQILIKEDICIDEFCVNLLEHTGVSVVPGTAFGDSKGFRLSYCGDYKTLKVGIEKINLFFLDKKWI
ncbi:aminotransferase class I/II-fold pyridoxal phosphate-dependent enzyme, partial [Acinetobacter lactucae]|uniref:aminotransferase class I/II-fold pyridoxal phosphate-dependent enzyme n=1 Tax=Acinetobacter lactucae TaxID=1785128 RepID=UPI00158014DD